MNFVTTHSARPTELYKYANTFGGEWAHRVADSGCNGKLVTMLFVSRSGLCQRYLLHCEDLALVTRILGGSAVVQLVDE